MNGFMIHTKSAMYNGGTYIGSGLQQDENRINQIADFAEGLERRFYQQFGCNDFQSFREKVSTFLRECEQDRKILGNFDNQKVRQILGKYIGVSGLTLRPTHLVATIDPAQFNFEFKINEFLQNDDFKVKITADNKFRFVIRPKASALKTLVNGVSKQIQDMPARKFRPNKTAYETQVSTELRKALMEMEANNILQLSMGGVGASAQEEAFFTKQMVENPFKLTKDDVKAMKENDPAKFEATMAQIKDIVINQMCAGGTEDLKKALKQTWARVKPEELFLVGNNLFNGVIGAMGEFGAVLWLNYVVLKAERLGMKGANVEFLGQVVKNGRQGAVDIGFLNSIGVQVKNINLFARSNIHTSRALADIPNQGFVEWVANAAFNSDVEWNEVGAINFIKDHIEDFLNLSLTKELYGLETKTVSFYAVGANFIPASAVYRAIATGINNIKITFTGMGEGQSDDYFRQEVPHNSSTSIGGTILNAIELEYAKTKKGRFATGPEDFNAGDKLQDKYKELINSITIQVEFNMLNIINSGNFSVR